MQATLCEPALDRLWACQSSVTNLVKCLPEESWQMCIGGSPTLIRHPLPAELDRFRYYAAKVRFLAIGSNASDDLVIALAARSQVPLFPNLQALHWWMDNYNLAYMLEFLVPRPRALNVTLDGESEGAGLNRLLDIVHTKTPALECFKFECVDSPPLPAPGRLISNSTCFASLRVLEWDPLLSVADIVALAALPNLQDLKFNATRIPSGVMLDFSALPGPPFSELATLRVQADTLQFCSDFVEAIRSCALRTLEVTAPGITCGDISSLLSRLRRRNLKSSLRVLHIHGGIQESAITMPLDMLRPLCCLANLEELWFRLPCAFTGTNIVLLDLVKAWPRLQVLQLGEQSRLGRSDFTLLVLEQLVFHCPHLRDLDISGLNINSTVTMEWKIKSSREERPVARNGELLELTLGRSIVGDPLEVAMLLSRIFPRLRSIQATDPHGKDVRWREVEKYIGIFNRIRREERSWWDSKDVKEE
ncbi:hypothetical protein GLOTRDRAFT_93125 [Gloeophyllum trabeum ATCC 11539]|uniref:F-box domain-containing protein n=1 Tax=Gloeophyllum trabeum (strain ATCC 11539 / FP-39264 / Madison 617) TaxID=670483 RepID=S7Q640_GLOTA|nr:uncharacterized protein GLOTRDRAFT_93125 [Gloeophyllum trabeum ATCC 11539]EPQ55491.1 hypothetical protein GLOTRDRAFT_93125 [Gloeophyllum trabeum ATCC 11539]